MHPSPLGYYRPSPILQPQVSLIVISPGLRLSAAALGHNHPFILVLVGDHVFLVQVKYGDWVELGGDAAGAIRLLGAGVDQGLYDSVLRRGQVVAQWEVTAAITLVSLQRHMVDT